MKKVFQTIVDKGKGNCMQAVVASLFEYSLDEIPNFIEFDGVKDTSSQFELIKFLRSKGYDYCYINRKTEDTTEFLKEIAKFDGGINGYFYASVPSQTFEGVSHAVIIDSNLNVVHDPNSNQLAMKLSSDDIEGFIIVTDLIIGKTGKLFKKKDWENTTEEERDLNTHKH